MIFLTMQHPRLATFNALLKTHKHLTRPPGWPIVLGNGNLTESGSQLIDLHLWPHIQRLSLYTKDTIYLLKHIEGLTIPPDALLVALDVEALHCHIPHDHGFQVIRSFLIEL